VTGKKPPTPAPLRNAGLVIRRRISPRWHGVQPFQKSREPSRKFFTAPNKRKSCARAMLPALGFASSFDSSYIGRIHVAHIA
jgi:hypothetical protein